MEILEAFALFVLIVLVLAAVAIWVVLAMMPGKIARERNHPQAAAINACGWWGALTLGLLMPLAFVWAYTNPRWKEDTIDSKSAAEPQPAEDSR